MRSFYFLSSASFDHVNTIVSIWFNETYKLLRISRRSDTPPQHNHILHHFAYFTFLPFYRFTMYSQLAHTALLAQFFTRSLLLL